MENILAESVQESPQGNFLGIAPETAQKVISSIEEGVEAFQMYNYQPVLLVSSVVRPHIKRLTERSIPNLVVLSHVEISPEVQIESLGTIEMVY